MDSKKEALKILKQSLVETMGTVQQNKPHTSYMAFLVPKIKQVDF